MAFWDEYYIRETTKEDRRFRELNEGAFDTRNYRKVEQLAKRFKSDPSYRREVDSEIKRLQKKAQSEIGNFQRVDYREVDSLGSIEGLNTSRSTLKEINLKNYRIEVDDADTLILRKKMRPSLKPISIRLSGIDAPETKHSNEFTDPLKKYRINQAQPLGEEASDRLRSILSKSTNLRLVVDPVQKTYGRYLGVLLDGNKNINLDMVRSGHVSSLEFGSIKTDMVDRSLFMKAGSEAEKSGKGIWGHQFFKNWKEMSNAYGSDITFNTLTNAIKLAENKAFGVGAGYIWGQGNSGEQLRTLGEAAKTMRENQSLVKTNLISNQAANPQNRREDRNTIEGLTHGWFGRLRSQNTDFGSPYLIKLQEAMAFDIETNDLRKKAGSTVQTGVYQRELGLHQVNILQDQEPKSPFLKRHTIPQLKREGGSFTKIQNPISSSVEYNRRGKLKTTRSTMDTQQAIAETERLLTQGKKRGPVLIQNARFEMDHFIGPALGTEFLDYSDEWKIARKRRSKLEKQDRLAYQEGRITKQELIKNRIKRQKEIFSVLKKDILSDGKIVDVQEIYKTLNAVAQEKGLIHATGNLAAGTSIDFISRAMYRTKEIHSAHIDAYDTVRTASSAFELIEKIEKMGASAKFSNSELGWLKTWGYGLSKKGRKKKAENILRGIRKRNKAAEVYQSAIKKTNSLSKVNIPNRSQVGSYRGKINKGALILGGAAVAATFANSFLFSGRDDNYNTIEALQHGWAGDQRRKHSDFGSGYRMDDFHGFSGPQETIDPIPASYVALGGMAAASAGLAMSWNKATDINIDDLGYLGRLSENELNSKILGRKKATVGEVFTSGVRRAEQSLGGMFRVFGVGDQLMFSILNNMELTIDLMKKKGNTHAQFLHSVTNRNLLEEGFTELKLSKNKLWGYSPQSKAYELVPGFYQAMPLAHNTQLTKTPTQSAQSYMRSLGHQGVDQAHNAFILTGGKNKGHAYARRFHAYTHETLVKGLKILDEPLGALSEFIPDLEESSVFRKIKNSMHRVPKLGTGGNYVGSVPELMTRHGARLGVAAAAMYYGYGTLDWLVKEFAPGEDNIVSEGGVAGLGALGLKSAHIGYSAISEATGLTALRAGIEELAPGTDGWRTAIGLTLSGGLAGATLASIGNIAEEIGAEDRYSQFLKNKSQKEKIDIPIGKDLNLNKLPGLNREYTTVGRYSRVGAVAGLALSLPFLVAGLGSSQTTAEWQAEYAGEKEVAVRKGRWWEASMTPWEGGKIDYYRPNWYARMKDSYAKAALYDGENLSPIGKTLRSLWDPYWLEKRRYAESPYPFTDADGSSFGMLGPIYEMTLGRGLKAPAYINREEFEREYANEEEKYPVYEELGGLPKGDPRDPSSFFGYLRRGIHTMTEGLGLRGFVASSIFEKATGEGNFDQYTPELESAAKLDSLSRAFYDLQLGGGVLTTEALRRLMPRERVGDTEYVNPMNNNMPDWLPGNEYYMNFQKGDPYTKVKEGYYRLPGAGYATRFEELEGIDPEDYPEIHKYRILADIAPDSQKFKTIRGRLQNRDLTDYERRIFETTESQLSEKASSVENFRDPDIYDSFLGKYTAAITDLARANPVEQLLPFSPARKFLPGTDPVDRYEELVYGKDFQDWKNPFSDFIRPATTMTANIFGAADIPEEIEYARGLEDYFDKLQFIKAQRTGNTGMAERTLTGLDPYINANEVLKRLPKRERPFFERFINANEEEREKILEIVPALMRDIYVAQWDKQAIAENPNDAELREEVVSRADQIRARKLAQIAELKESGQLPSDDWIGWDTRVDLEDVKMQYLINEGRDYHYHGLWKDRLNLLARKPYVADAAQEIDFSREGILDAYEEARSAATASGIQAADILVMPGIEPSYNVNIVVDRREERHDILREMGQIL